MNPCGLLTAITYSFLPCMRESGRSEICLQRLNTLLGFFNKLSEIKYFMDGVLQIAF